MSVYCFLSEIKRKRRQSIYKSLKSRNGSVSLEFVFAFSFLLIFFVIIFSFQIITIHRIAAATSVWRIQRVGSFVGENELFVVDDKDKSDGSLKDIILGAITEYRGFGDIVLSTLEQSKIKVIRESEVEYKVEYYTPFLVSIDKYLYGGESQESISDNIIWIEPGPPPLEEDHE